MRKAPNSDDDWAAGTVEPLLAQNEIAGMLNDRGRAERRHLPAH